MRVISKPVNIGWLATLIIFGIAIWAGFSEYCVESGCTNKFAVLSDSRPNEIGDTLAGFAGALAFVWIIVTVALQSKELAAQREELQLTRKEMEEQRKATQGMARSLAAQASVFEDEQRRRTEIRSSECLEEAANHLHRCLPYAELSTLRWYFTEATQQTSGVRFFESCPHCADPDETMALLAELFGVALRKIRRADFDKLQFGPKRPKELLQMEKYLGLIVGCLEDLPSVKRARLEELNMRDAHRDMSYLLGLPIWDQVEEMQI
nr:hypothetical protein [uncultured Shimia sp.]